MARKLVLIVVDGMTPAAFERAVESGRAPALALLAAHGSYRRATSVFPSLTPVCLSSIATGSTPAVHHIPHLVWWHREERRIVEYGSSFSALRAAGMAQSLADTIYNMNAEHLSRDAETIFETLDNDGLVTAAVNITCYRGHTKHLPTLPWVTKAAYGPKRFFYYSLFESDKTGAPLAVRNRAAGSIDVYAAAVGRWLITRDGFDMLAYYLSDFDYASHAYGPEGAEDVALERTDAAIEALIDAAGGADAFFERYAVVLLSDHGQTRGLAGGAARGTPCGTRGRHRRCRVESRRADLPAARRARRRVGDRACARRRAVRRGDAVARGRRRGCTPRTRRASLPTYGDGWETSGDTSILDYPDALHRAWQALANPNAGEVLVSAAPGWEFVDLGGRHHAGGGSHGSLVEGDSIVPVVTVGIDAAIERITDVTPALIAHAATTALPDRRAMVEQQLRARGIDDERVLAAMARVPRELFVPPAARARAYDDAALPIGAEQTISQPYMVARICAELRLRGRRDGARHRYRLRLPGRGARRASREVHSIERIPELAATARDGARRRRATRTASTCTTATARSACRTKRPFAAIAVAAAARQPPHDAARPARAPAGGS